MSKTILIIFLVLAAIAIGGGSFYYFEIYQPTNYAVSLLSLYQKLEGNGLQPDTSLLKGGADYAGALKILEERTSSFKSIKGELSQIPAPKRMANFNKEFSAYLDFVIVQHSHGLKLAAFFEQAGELRELIAGIYGADLAKEKIVTVGNLQKLWGERIPKTVSTGKVLFREEIMEFTSPSFSELKLLWEGAAPAFDIVLKRINLTNPRLLISQGIDIFTPAEMKQLEVHTKKLEEFTKQLDALLKKYSAHDLLAFRYFPDVSSTESSERVLKFYQSIQTLKEQYSK